MRKIVLLSSLLVVILFLVSCAPREQMSDEELEAELSGLSPEELEAVTAEGSAAIAGMAKANPRLATLRKVYQQVINVAATPQTCSDSDADANNPTGLDVFEKGTATWTGGPAAGADDTCSDENTLLENYCSGDSGSTGVHLTKSVNCGDYDAVLGGYWKCAYGACVEFVVENAQNNNPDLAILTAIETPAGTYPTFTLQASDADGDTLTFSATLDPGINPSDFVLDANTGFTGWNIPANQAPGSYSVTYTVVDGNGGSDSGPMVFFVTSS